MTTLALLKALQLGDSFFPSGANVFSHGLEGLREAGDLRDANDVGRFVEAQLEHRWLCADRVAVCHAVAAAPDLTRLLQLDVFVDRSTLVESWRIGGRRLGRSLLRVHSALATPDVAAYSELVRSGAAPGQAAAVQGLIAHASGLCAQEAGALSGYGLALSLVSAALRLGLLGHLDAQRILSRANALLTRLLELPLPALDSFSSWLPEAEIASMRQEARHGRLFAS